MSRNHKMMDRINVVDLESTCWEGKPPPDQSSEIIEIGICTLDVTSGELLEQESILIKPQCSQVSEFCTHLTTITQQMVNEGIPFSEACEILQNKYASRRRTWASYGDYDRKMMLQQCSKLDIAYPFGDTHINIKNILAVLLGFPKEAALDQALELLDMPLIGTHHRGVDDAWNMAEILSRMLLNVRKAFPPEVISRSRTMDC